MQEGRDVASIPKDLNALLERKFLFKIRVTDYNLKQKFSTYTVMKISDDENLMKNFNAANNARVRINSLKDKLTYNSTL